MIENPILLTRIHSATKPFWGVTTLLGCVISRVAFVKSHFNDVWGYEDENGIKYGDVIEGVNFDYARKLTSVNAISLAGLGWAPPAPEDVRIGGAVQPSTTLQWKETNDPNIAGYKIYGFYKK